MTTLVTRAGKGSPLTNAEMDANLENLNNSVLTTGGTSTAYTLTPSPALGALAARNSFRISFNAASGATPTLAVSGLTAKNIKYYDAAGAKQAITSAQVPINWTSAVEYDGTDWVVLQPANVAAAGANADITSASAITGIGNTRTTDITISAAGEVTKPLQPAFSAYVPSSVTNVTGDGTVYVVLPTAEVFDVNGDFSSGPGQLTAPVTGKYSFSISLYLYVLTAGTTQVVINLITSNRTYLLFDSTRENGYPIISCGFAPVDMDAGDVTYVTVTVSGTTKTISVGANYTRFAGYLIG